VERILADIDADHGDRCVEFLRHGVLLVLGAPCQLVVLAGPEHGRTIPLADMDAALPQPVQSKSLPVVSQMSRRQIGVGQGRQSAAGLPRAGVDFRSREQSRDV
jgi:hypothetical protein